MISADGRHVIIYNGEIYSFLELARELEGLGRRLRSASDTEVILLAYAEWGVDMFRRLNGMWSLALYDIWRGELLLSRDRFRVKPMYYYVDGECLIFALEIQAIEKLIPDRGDQVATFCELFHDACRIRLPSDVPVATCLSGGMDSGSIVSLLGRERASEAPRFPPFSHRSFTAAFPGAISMKPRTRAFSPPPAWNSMPM